MKKEVKTNAMRILDKHKINYQVHTYDFDDNNLGGEHVANELHQDPNRVFKTLIGISKSKQYYVFVIPVNKELDLKKCAKCVNEKNIELIPVKELMKVTGYIRGGCSPIGMKKLFTTVFYESALDFDSIYFSGGKRGLQIECNFNDIKDIINAKTADIIKS